MKEEEVKEYLWESFLEWMNGQTVGINENGSIDYYDSDVMRFCRK